MKIHKLECGWMRDDGSECDCGAKHTMKNLQIKLNNKWYDVPFYVNKKCSDTTAKTIIEDVKWSKPTNNLNNL